MPTELEAKIRVESLDAVRGRLVELSARKVSHRTELNIYFDTPDRALLRSDSGLRVRSMRAIDEPSAPATSVITFKGPQAADSALKSREEIEFGVDDSGLATALLSRLGYQAELGFEKRRESWHLAGCTIELDELPLLGTFVEVEGDTRDAVMSALQLLGLESAPLITESYIAMVARAMPVAAAADRVLRFQPRQT